MADVIVLDEDGKVISKTKPAMARKLLRKKEAYVVYKEPFMIQLTKSSQPINFGGNKMQRLQISQLLSTEQNLYIQNISGGVVSMEFKDVNGRPIPFRLANTREPICMTDAVPWAILKGDITFRELLNRENIGKPPWVNVFTQPQYEDYLEKRSQLLDQSKDELKTRAVEKHSYINEQKREAPLDPKDQLRDEVKDKSVLSDIEIINPRILGVCQRLHPESDNPIDPLDALDIFESFDILTEDDFNYIISHSYNTIIKKWAHKKQLGDGYDNVSNSMATSNTIIRDIDDQRDIPPVVAKKKRGRPKKRKA